MCSINFGEYLVVRLCAFLCVLFQNFGVYAFTSRQARILRNVLIPMQLKRVCALTGVCLSLARSLDQSVASLFYYLAVDGFVSSVSYVDQSRNE